MRVGGLRRRAATPAEAGIVELRLSSGPKRRIKDFDGLRDDVLKQDGAI